MAEADQLAGCVDSPKVGSLEPVGAENSVTSCDLPILVYQATEAVLS